MNNRSSWLLRLCIALAAILALPGRARAQFEVDQLTPNIDPNGAGIGSALAIDGDTALVGASLANVTGYSSGAAFVFRRVAGNWTQEDVLVPNDPQVGQGFGWSVAIAGNRAFVSAYGAGSLTFSGAVYVFRRVGSFPFATWDQIAKLEPSDPAANQAFGTAIGASGNTLVVGCYGPGSQGSAAYFFGPQSGAWQLTQRLAVPQGIGHRLAMDGDRVALASTGQPYPHGEVRIYTNTASGWQYETTLAPPPGQSEQSFGDNIAFQNGLLAVSQRGFVQTGVVPDGRLWLARFDAGAWSGLVPLDWASVYPSGQMGYAVAANGSEFITTVDAIEPSSTIRRLLVVGRWDSSASGPAWLGTIDPPNLPGINGWGGTLAAQGSDVLVPRGDGSISVLSLVPPAPVTYCTSKLNSAGCVATVSSVGSASATSTVPFEVKASSIVSGKYGLLFFGINGRTSFPFQGGYLCALPPTRRTPAQSSGGNAGANDCSGSYSFDFNALIRSGAHPDLDPGVLVNAQYWYRDPASQSTTGLTNAIEFGVGF